MMTYVKFWFINNKLNKIYKTICIIYTILIFIMIFTRNKSLIKVIYGSHLIIIYYIVRGRHVRWCICVFIFVAYTVFKDLEFINIRRPISKKTVKCYVFLGAGDMYKWIFQKIKFLKLPRELPVGVFKMYFLLSIVFIQTFIFFSYTHEDFNVTFSNVFG